MKKIKFGGNNQFSAALAILALLLVAVACGGTKPDLPSDSTIQSLVKNTTSDFTDAVDKNDFKAFLNKTSPEFQSQFSEDKLKAAFKTLIDAKDRAVPLMRDAAKKDAKFSSSPSIREENGNYILTTAGTIPSTPQETKFNYEYVWRDNDWKLSQIEIRY